MNPVLGLVLSQAGAAIKNAYGGTTGGTVFQASRVKRLRLYVDVVTDPASALTSITLKLQHRYNDPSVNPAAPLGWLDLPTNLDDVQGAAQPKGYTRELEHAFTVNANAPNLFDFSFWLDQASMFGDLRVNAHANAAGLGADALKVYAFAGGSD